MSIRNSLPTLLFIAVASLAFSQKFIQLERVNRPRTLKFYAGDELTYRFKGDAFWRNSLITDVNMDSQRVAFDGRYYALKEIEAIQLQYAGLLRATGPALMFFGASWAGYSLIGALFDNYPLTTQTVIVSGSGLLIGFGLKHIFKYRKVSLNERRRLRAVEIPVSIPLRPGY
ncbi:MAG: hypothetical protein NZM43_04515 [Saprospiraceae bacterium]|nr:hypothetical protein [Saprospiraceae bacterium]MDW8483572.1 hypothetical protein [Saprospiraceae bacterium]